MIVDDLWTAKGPTAAELKVLERLGRRRQAFEAVTPADEEDAIVIARANATLDDMEECLCEEGAKAPYLARGWRVLDQLEARLEDLRNTPGATAGSPPARQDSGVVPIRRRTESPNLRLSAAA